MKFAFAFAFSAQLLGHDSWMSADKVKHFVLATFVQSAGFGLMRTAGAAKTPAIIGASAVSLSAVVGKELRDRNGRGDPSVKDAVWGLAGAAAITPVLLKTR
jgi:uncharacterized protein YfiM (DUF2279 family)